MLTVSGCHEDIETVVADSDLGKKYLLSALDSGDRQKFLVALHEIMDAILQELESN